MSDLRTRIAAVHQAHRWGVFRCNDGYARTCCRCQWRETPDSPTHAEHVADVLIRELPELNECTQPSDAAERLDCIGRWMKPSLWSGLDSRREAILRILKGQILEPPNV